MLLGGSPEAPGSNPSRTRTNLDPEGWEWRRRKTTMTTTTTTPPPPLSSSVRGFFLVIIGQSPVVYRSTRRYIKFLNITPVPTKVHVMVIRSCVNMHAWWWRISVPCDIMEWYKVGIAIMTSHSDDDEMVLASMWSEFFGECRDSWYKGRNCDNKKGGI